MKHSCMNQGNTDGRILKYYINLIPYVRDGDVQIQTDGLCPFENESPTGNLKKLTQVYTDKTD